ncbi:hypothetical protein FXB39_00630 [Nocardioides sp. BGMRC 2183]|nr:hypothetical protein FXB39_00630 [Nocardioides sp. BGMRC 2183]
MTVQEATEQTGRDVVDQVLAALAAYQAGTLTADAFAALVASFLAAGKTAGLALGDAAFVAQMQAATGTAHAFPGTVLPESEVDRLQRAAETIRTDLDRDQNAEKAAKRLTRLAEAEIKKAAADALAGAIRTEERVTGWVRVLEPAPTCQLCHWWYRDGRVWPSDHPMPRHTGCDCTQRIVTLSEPAKPVRYH